MESTTARQVRLCVVGDELTAGVGDARALGWIGRVIARSHFDGPAHVSVLTVPDEDTSGLSQRWLGESRLRFGPESECDNRLVIGLGRHDVDSGISLARSRLNLANMLDVAEERLHIPAFVVGPPPGHASDNEALADLSTAFGDVSSRRRVPYVDTFTPLVAHEQWLADMAQSPQAYPGQAGYGLMTWLVLHTGWYEWLDQADAVG